MEKIDILIGLLGFASYVAIMLDLRSYEQKISQYEAIQEKRRNYVQRLMEQRKAERSREIAAEKKAAKQLEVKHMAGVVEKLGELQDAEVMRKSKVTSGKIA